MEAVVKTERCTVIAKNMVQMCRICLKNNAKIQRPRRGKKGVLSTWTALALKLKLEYFFLNDLSVMDINNYWYWLTPFHGSWRRS